MDIQTFSTTYWYVWFLAVLLIVILVILNGFGFFLYHRRRQNFLNKSNERNENIPMSDISTSSNNHSSSILISDRTITTTSSSNRTRTINPRFTLRSIPKIAPIPEDLENSTHESRAYSNMKSEMDLSLEEFQRQALNEHNAMRKMYKKSPLKLSESLNLYAQYWAEQCALMKTAIPSRMEWRLHCKGEPLGENIVSVKSTDTFDGGYFTSLIMANGNHSYEVDCVLNEISNEVGFGRAQTHSTDHPSQQQWIGVAHYYPYHRLTAVQS